ncbi:alkaline phosphatase family protein [Fulvivirgaceae bacterium BMA10]|uniref:Alkaline phosphatase family protein n=1 Tax=Splendidivirga corallicola TaxID=3051826 RepID=A0ABT8KVX5_9BACT|nr:alkaline phosphatase family protein [Fulvivirgaceae bacterium BMA10]
MNKSVINLLVLSLIIICAFGTVKGQISQPKKCVFIILDGISADALEQVATPTLDDIADIGGYTRAYVGGSPGTYSETPTISAVGYNSLLTATWANKHNVWGNGIKAPNYFYWNIFRLALHHNEEFKTAIFSTWLDNRTKLIGEGLSEAGGINLDYAFDGFELDTINFPHDEQRKFIFNIDEHVSKEASRYIKNEGPDLSWVYLEFTDDIGHKFGDSPQFHDAIRLADKQVKRIWEAIRFREKQFNEDWMIMITTDHGRDKATGKHHGGQSERERLTWIVTNHANLNQRFQDRPGVVDIMPSMCRHMSIEIPTSIKQEIDGVPFVGKTSIGNLTAKKTDHKIQLNWKPYDIDGEVEIFLTTTNHFKKGKSDNYQKVGTTLVKDGRFTLDVKNNPSDFYKILIKAPHNWLNVWVVDE